MIRTLNWRPGRILLVATVGLAAAAVPVSPAFASVTSASAYVWAYSPSTPSYTIPVVDSGPTWMRYLHAANDGNGPITITRTAVGRYRVSFGGLGAVMPSSGTAHVAPYGSTPNLCTVVSWVRAGEDLRITVGCFDPEGAPADTSFVANFVALSGIGDDVWPYSYLWADQPAAADYAPNWLYRYDTTGAASRVVRDGVGTYRAYLPSSTDETTLTYYQTSAYSTEPVACATVGYLGDGWVRVLCRDAAGVLVDSRFSLSYTPNTLLVRVAPTYQLRVRATAVYAAVAWVSESSTSHLVTASRRGVGDYEVYLPEIGSDIGHAVVHSSASSGRVCSVKGWIHEGPDEWIQVRCVNHLGVSADSSFFAAFTW